MSAKTKKQLLLVKQDYIEPTLNSVEPRKSMSLASMVKSAMDNKASVFSDAMEEWMAQIKPRVENGVAIIPIRGTVTPDDPFAVFFGETSLTTFNKNFQKALSDPTVKSIVLDISSPGGYVYGVEAAANAIYAARGQKPITAFTGSLAASAAYWLASAASKIVLASETTEVGSIGVYMAHFDYSKMLEALGIAVTEITAGKYKGLGSPLAPLTKEEEKLLQDDVDYIYTRFVDTVARNRKMGAKDVVATNALTYYGSDAVKLGLADSIQSLQEIIMSKDTGTAAVVEQPVVAAATPAAPAVAPAVAATAVDTEKTAMAAELAAYKKKEADEKAAAISADYKKLVKASLGRDATEDEVAAYTEASEKGRKVMETQLEESAKRTDRVVKAAGLTTEQVNEGQDPDHDPQNNPLVLAVRKLQAA